MDCVSSVGCGGSGDSLLPDLCPHRKDTADQLERQWLRLRSKEPQEGLWISGKWGGGRGSQAREALAEVRDGFLDSYCYLLLSWSL